MKNELTFLNFADEDERRLISRAFESAEKNSEHEFCLPLFLNLREQKLLKSALASSTSFPFTFFGGYKDAERCVLIIFPEYLMYTELLEPGYIDCADEKILKLCSTIAKEAVLTVKISCSKFEKLTHRDYMGAILALGTERSAIGDIVLTSDNEAYVIASAKIAEFILNTLTSVGRTRVCCEFVKDTQNISLFKKTSEHICVSSSLRFDCVVSAITGVSRDKSKTLINTGHAELNFYSKASPDDSIENGDIISVRGYGKYKIADTNAKTSKGKYRLTVLKYI